MKQFGIVEVQVGGTKFSRVVIIYDDSYFNIPGISWNTNTELYNNNDNQCCVIISGNIIILYYAGIVKIISEREQSDIIYKKVITDLMWNITDFIIIEKSNILKYVDLKKSQIYEFHIESEEKIIEIEISDNTLMCYFENGNQELFDL